MGRKWARYYVYNTASQGKVDDLHRIFKISAKIMNSEISTGRRPMRSDNMPTGIEKILLIIINVKKASGIKAGSIPASCERKTRNVSEKLATENSVEIMESH